ncbi:probable polygalacturonase At3g15720 [Herrania umbratica]|uniref:Probable polygalacturonase At3g15720 n=1 Tax=Herrania umbratica TaxID=108875 RepID=A0A6J0ZKY9_9ROSI|nr:probable polygalacturonase At3g15720 [Herrania umbratica]
MEGKRHKFKPTNRRRRLERSLLVVLGTQVQMAGERWRTTDGDRGRRRWWVKGSSNLGIGDGQNTLNVLKFGAVGDGKTDDSHAFLTAWQALCGARGRTSTLVIPASKTFLVSHVQFLGPCSSSRVHIQVLGKIVAPEANAWSGRNSDCWLCFMGVHGLVIDGSGEIDGNGETWWNKPPSCRRPTALHFHICDNLKLSGLRHLDSPSNHITIHSCNGVSATNLRITAPADSPNTDGIDIAGSTQVDISDSFIGTGDDCVAIKGGCSNINITKVTCGPGHGISIGSLGQGGANDQVEHVHVRDCTFNGTQNGARIKTIPGGSGFARQISFEQITLIASRNPIYIDQYYCNGKASSCPDVGKATAISGVTYIGFHGTSADDKAINLDCSDQGCTGITIENVNITSSVQGQPLQAICNNAHGRATSTVPVVSCLLP